MNTQSNSFHVLCKKTKAARSSVDQYTSKSNNNNNNNNNIIIIIIIINNNNNNK